MILTMLLVLIITFVQNTSFTLVSRARNRDNKAYHIGCSIFSNGIWFLTFSILVKNDMNLVLFVPYIIGAVTGSLFGAKVAIWIEKKIGAKT